MLFYWLDFLEAFGRNTITFADFRARYFYERRFKMEGDSKSCPWLLLLDDFESQPKNATLEITSYYIDRLKRHCT